MFQVALPHFVDVVRWGAIGRDRYDNAIIVVVNETRGVVEASVDDTVVRSRTPASVSYPCSTKSSGAIGRTGKTSASLVRGPALHGSNPPCVAYPQPSQRSAQPSRVALSHLRSPNGSRGWISELRAEEPFRSQGVAPVALQARRLCRSDNAFYNFRRKWHGRKVAALIDPQPSPQLDNAILRQLTTGFDRLAES